MPFENLKNFGLLVYLVYVISVDQYPNALCVALMISIVSVSISYAFNVVADHKDLFSRNSTVFSTNLLHKPNVAMHMQP